MKYKDLIPKLVSGEACTCLRFLDSGESADGVSPFDADTVSGTLRALEREGDDVICCVLPNRAAWFDAERYRAALAHFAEDNKGKARSIHTLCAPMIPGVDYSLYFPNLSGLFLFRGPEWKAAIL